MQRLNPECMSGGSPITTGQAADILGCSPESVRNFVGSCYIGVTHGDRCKTPHFGRCPYLRPDDRTPWAKARLESVVALRDFLPSNRKGPWGLKGDWDHLPVHYHSWFEERKEDGYHYAYIDGQACFYGPD